MPRSRLGRWTGAGLVLALVAILAAGCLESDQSILLRSDMPTNGLDVGVTYRIEAAPDGSSEINQAVLQGLNEVSPMPLLTTTFGKGAGTRTQMVQATTANGLAANVLGMNKPSVNFGLTKFEEVQPANYEFRDAAGNRLCGVKVRMNFKPNLIQQLKNNPRSWDALWYYDVPCPASPDPDRVEISQAHFRALVINQQWQFRITGKPIVFNQGHSVTIVGGKPAAIPPGWWETNASATTNDTILGAQKLLRSMVADLDTSPKPWLAFKADGPFADSQLIYSAGDANKVFTLQRAFLNRQTDYVVNLRSDPAKAWRTIVVHPVYNYEWNDFGQNWEAIKGHNPFKIDDRLNAQGFPKDPNDDVIKEIETEGCQNCQNATLEQIQLRDGATGRILYGMTIRGYIGAESSLVMFGGIPDKGSLGKYEAVGEKLQKNEGYTDCPTRYDENGNALSSDQQLSDKRCAELLREGAMWRFITENPDRLGFDLVSQYRVRDNSTWKQVCSGSGDNTSCSLVADESKLNATYLFNTQNVMKPWTVLQMLGEVGVRSLGLSYVSGPGTGSGMLFAMAQSLMRQQYKNGVTNPEMVFAFDARALQLPATIAAAEQILFGPNS
ncbi:MAG: hypothetical protein HY974_04155 [Candidatus Kerfeldbacteria bacterium]|nr:hypothetical protein [Candidatus Kerfeldbacteria bacterium]